MQSSTIDTIIESIEQYKQNNNYPRAREIALEALKEHTDDYRLYEELADIHLYEGNIDGADEVLHIAREIHPESGTGMYLEGYIATVKGDFDRAINVLEVANQNLPNNAEILRNLGWAYFMKTETRRGLALLRRAYALAPEEGLIINDLAVALMASGEESEARELLQKIGQEHIVDAFKKTLQ